MSRWSDDGGTETEPREGAEEEWAEEKEEEEEGDEQDEDEDEEEELCAAPSSSSSSTSPRHSPRLWLWLPAGASQSLVFAVHIASPAAPLSLSEVDASAWTGTGYAWNELPTAVVGVTVTVAVGDGCERPHPSGCAWDEVDIGMGVTIFLPSTPGAEQSEGGSVAERIGPQGAGAQKAGAQGGVEEGKKPGGVCGCEGWDGGASEE